MTNSDSEYEKLLKEFLKFCKKDIKDILKNGKAIELKKEEVEKWEVVRYDKC